jgi:hypothetical protein
VTAKWVINKGALGVDYDLNRFGVLRARSIFTRSRTVRGGVNGLVLADDRKAAGDFQSRFASWT